MNFGRYLLRRVGWTVLAGSLVLTVAFVVFAYTSDATQAVVEFYRGEGGLEAYRAARNYDAPILRR